MAAKRDVHQVKDDQATCPPMTCFSRHYGGWPNAMGRLLVIFAVLFVQFAEARAESTAEPAISFAARLVGDDKRARLIVDFNRDVDHDSFLLNNPRRLIVDLPSTLFSLGEEARRVPTSLAKSIRFLPVMGEGSRIELLLNGPVRIETSRVKPVSGGLRHRLLVDMVKTDEDEFASLVRKEKLPVVREDDKPKKSFVLVLDPGHGGIDGGATGRQGTLEKQITLSFAQKLKAQLERDKHIKVLMTRSDDRFLRLQERMETARDAKAALFISIHADSLRQRSIRGATIYTLSERGSDEVSRSLARKQNRADLIAGLELPVLKPRVTDILIDLTRRESEAFSIRFAELMVRHLGDDIRLIRNPHRSADFFVLKAPEVPSILLELGYLSNAQDESLMRSAKWQTLAASRAADAIRSFFSPRLEGGSQ